MKKFTCLILTLLCICSLSSCSSPMTKEYTSVEDLVMMLEAEYDGKEKQLEQIAENESICNFFQDDSKKRDSLIKALCDSDLSLYAICDIYDACNETEWYNRLLDSEGTPLLMVNHRPTFKEIADKIKTNFKDPLSVSVIKASIHWKEPKDNATMLHSNDLMILATVRATNGFGAYTTKDYLISCKLSEEGDFIYNYEIAYEASSSAKYFELPALGFVSSGSGIYH